MKILKIFGVVVGIHVFALILIFANPGCSSTNKPAATATASPAEPVPVTAAPTNGDVPPTIVSTAAPADSPVSAAPMATPEPASSAPVAVRFSPTRPGTPAATMLESQPVGDVTPATTYTVERGDSLWSIAKKNHVSVGEVAAANNLKASSMVKVGQRLIIPGRPQATDSGKVIDAAPAKPAAAMDMAPAPKASGETVKHTVKPGETLGAIARKYQVKVGDIATANNIADPAKIRPGMVLTIPGWQAPEGRSAAKEKPTTAATPPASQDLDAGVKPAAGEPPVIQVDAGTSAPQNP